MNATHHPDTGLPDALMNHARVATDGELALEVAGGLLVGIALGAWRPIAWVPLTCASLCVAAFGGWGIIDRELRERTARSTAAIRLLRAGRAIVASAGAIAAIVLLFALLSGALGTWIS